MRIELSARARGVPPEAALAWWMDFREGATDHAGVPGQRRRIETREEGRVTMVDETRPLGVLVFRERVTAWREGMTVRFRGENSVSAFDGQYAFEPDGQGGTVVRLAAHVRLRRALRPGDALGKPVALAILRLDLRHHARTLEKDHTKR